MKMSAIYGVSVTVNMGSSAPVKRSQPNGAMKGYLNVSFSCDPETILLLEKVVLDEVDLMRRLGPTPSEVLTAVKAGRATNEEYKRTNNYWVKCG
jgi:hypothetical protein